jgi:hypothetical protein
MSSSLKCSRIVSAIPWQAYRLPSDGRKVRSRCAQRRSLLVFLSQSANFDGTNIFLSVPTMAKATGDSERTVAYVLDDLMKLGFLTKGRLTHFNGPRIRAINLEAVVLASAARLGDVEPQDSDDRPASFDANRTASLDTQNRKLGICSSASYTADSPGNPPILQPTVKTLTENLPSIPGRLQDSDGWQIFVKAFQPSETLRNAPMTKAEEARLRSGVARFGPVIMADAAKRWISQRSVVGMKASPWHFFIKEHAPFIAEAIYNSDEAVEARILAAEEQARKVHAEENARYEVLALIRATHGDVD